MDIIYDFQVFSWQRFGGVSRYFFELITRMVAEAEPRVSMFQGLHVNRYGLEACQARFRRYFGLRYQVPSQSGRLVGVNCLNRLLFNRFLGRSKAGVYHPTYYTYLGPDFRGQRVVTVYDMTHEIYPECFPRDRTTSPAKRRSVAAADGVICISESTKQDLMRLWGVPAEKIRVIHLANSLRMPAALDSIVDAPYLLFVGTRWAYKNFEFLLRGYAASKAIRESFRLVCFGGGSFDPAERALIHSLGLSDRVRHCQGPDAMLATLYRHAAAMVYPSRYEGFGFPPLEAMHYGCPVLASNTSSIPEVVGEAGLLFDPTEREDLVHKLERVLGDTALQQRLIAAGHQRERTYSWDACARQTLEFYRELTGA